MKRSGFTLIEVMIAMVILSVILLFTGQMTARMVHTVTTSGQQNAANELAQGRIARIQTEINYAGLESLYVATETTFPTLPGFTRTTQITHITTVTPPNDYKKVTVTVNGPGLAAPIARTVTVAAP